MRNNNIIYYDTLNNKQLQYIISQFDKSNLLFIISDIKLCFPTHVDTDRIPGYYKL